MHLMDDNHLFYHIFLYNIIISNLSTWNLVYYYCCSAEVFFLTIHKTSMILKIFFILIINISIITLMKVIDFANRCSNYKSV